MAGARARTEAVAQRSLSEAFTVPSSRLLSRDLQLEVRDEDIDLTDVKLCHVTDSTSHLSADVVGHHRQGETVNDDESQSHDDLLPVDDDVHIAFVSCPGSRRVREEVRLMCERVHALHPQRSDSDDLADHVV